MQLNRHWTIIKVHYISGVYCPTEIHIAVLRRAPVIIGISRIVRTLNKIIFCLTVIIILLLRIRRVINTLIPVAHRVAAILLVVRIRVRFRHTRRAARHTFAQHIIQPHAVASPTAVHFLQLSRSERQIARSRPLQLRVGRNQRRGAYRTQRRN